MLTTTTEAVPTFPLARFVEEARELVPVDGRVHHDWLPDGRTSLVFRVLDGGRRGDVSLAGPRTHARVKDLSGVVRAVVLKFKPGWSVPLFGVAASEVVDRIVPLDDLWGAAGGELFDRLLETTGAPDLLARVAEAIARRVQRSFEPSSAALARRAARLLEDGEERIDRVAERLGVTARHLRRTFIENIGVGPKEFARTVRLQRALRLAASSKDWCRIAADVGYYDQAHLIADFRQLIGVTPGAFVSHAREADLRCY